MSHTDRIGVVPKDWNIVHANSVLQLHSGMRPSQFVTDNPNDVPSLGGENIDENGFLIFDNIRYISRDYYQTMKKGKIKDKDILINKDGANTGKIAFSKQKPFEECAINEHVFIIRNNGEFEQEFLFYFLYSKIGNNQITRKIVGSAQGGINNSFTKGVYIPKPPKPEQTAIATILSKVDEAIEVTNQSIKAAEKLKKALMQNLLSGKLKPDGTWRTKDEFYEDEKFGKFPKGWEVARVKDYGFVQTGKTPPTAEPNVFSENKDELRFPFITPGDLGELKYISSSDRYVTSKGISYSYKIPIGAICVVCIGSTIGKIGIATMESCTNQQINTLIPNEDNSGEFFYYMMEFRKNHFKEIAGINATPQINRSDFNKYKMLRPKDKIEQEKIALKLLSIDEDILKRINKIKSLERLKKSLMQHLLTGKKRLSKETIAYINQNL